MAHTAWAGKVAREHLTRQQLDWLASSSPICELATRSWFWMRANNLDSLYPDQREIASAAPIDVPTIDKLSIRVLVDQQHDEASPWCALRVGRRERIDLGPCRRCAHGAKRIRQPHVFNRRHGASAAVDIHLEVAGRQVGDLSAIGVEGRHVDRHQIHARSKHRGGLGTGGLRGRRLGEQPGFSDEYNGEGEDQIGRSHV